MEHNLKLGNKISWNASKVNFLVEHYQLWLAYLSNRDCSIWSYVQVSRHFFFLGGGMKLYHKIFFIWFFLKIDVTVWDLWQYLLLISCADIWVFVKFKNQSKTACVWQVKSMKHTTTSIYRTEGKQTENHFSFLKSYLLKE